MRKYLILTGLAAWFLLILEGILAAVVNAGRTDDISDVAVLLQMEL